MAECRMPAPARRPSDARETATPKAEGARAPEAETGGGNRARRPRREAPMAECRIPAPAPRPRDARETARPKASNPPLREAAADGGHGAAGRRGTAQVRQ